MDKEKETINLLPEEAKENEIKNRSNRRMFFGLLFLAIFLLFYIVYSLVLIFTHL